MLRSAKGEVSVGVIIGIVLLIVVIIGLVMWSKNKKTDDVGLDGSGNVPALNDQTGTTGTPAAGAGAPGTTTTTTTTTTTPGNPSLPQTGLGPNE